MGLISTEVWVGLTSKNIKWYEDLGYKIPKWVDSRNKIRVKRNTKILVKVEDLPDGSSSVKVDVKCDGCGEIITGVKWQDYKKYVKEDGKYYCQRCAKNGYKSWESVSITHPYLIKYFINTEDTIKYSKGSKIELPMKCPYCGLKKKMKIPTLIRGFGCSRCSDGISYPQKFLFNMFQQLLDNNFEAELSKTTFKWCKNYKYDFYINKFNGIICECHGKQHYENSKSNWDSLEDIRKNDKDKEDLAKENDIENYIVLDCRQSELKWVKDNIMNSKLPILLSFKESDIDWLKCHEYSCSSLVKIACDLWNSGMQSVSKIKTEMRMGDCAIGRYLKRGNELGWCIPPYSPIEAMYILRKKVICVTTGQIFESIMDASIKLNIKEASISQCCKNKNYRTAGKSEITGEKLVWLFYDDYILKTKEEIDVILNNAQDRVETIFVKVICLTTEEVFRSRAEAGRAYNINPGNISSCCLGKQAYVGKHPETGEKLKWMDYNKYLEHNK